ncbi:hypothetical protein BpHYR1_040681 [Brachionus plicatilis]|uniref:Uncharacterized protein n=1 Tax=Brachionus plicatilis TaxID=10195 RepID=A0A3M7STV7_BRAPC|nr:hypothetical protein BpHYR1_040681 [Brachionus plicatilis]
MSKSDQACSQKLRIESIKALKSNELLVTNPIEIVNILNEYFLSVFIIDTSSCLPPFNSKTDKVNSMNVSSKIEKCMKVRKHKNLDQNSRISKI